MKTSFQKFVLAAFVVFGISVSSFSQVTKSAMESIMTQQGITMASVKTVYVYNVKNFYTDGSTRYVYEQYDNLKFGLNETGLTIQGKSVQLFPYSTMRHVMVSESSITVHLM